MSVLAAKARAAKTQVYKPRRGAELCSYKVRVCVAHCDVMSAQSCSARQNGRRGWPGKNRATTSGNAGIERRLYAVLQ